MRDVWEAGDAYEAYVGRWSRLVAARFVPWLGVPGGLRWLDVGCGTGALSSAARAAGADVVGVDPSRGFLAGRDGVVVGDGRALPFAGGVFDVVVSGLALNFMSDVERAVAEQVRVVVPGGTVAAYVWDYAEGMEMMCLFWAAAREVDPGAPDEGARLPVCRPEPLAGLWRASGLEAVTVEPIDVPTVFAGFAEFWRPFLGGQGAAPAYLATLPPAQRDAVRDALRLRLPAGDIRLTARAWAVRGIR
jgi:SAM-dependent methyltransferase